jgi:hypothetical protein
MNANQTEDEEESVAILVLPEDYRKNSDQVARISNRKIIYVKGKLFALKPFELVALPISQCSSIEYERRLAIAPMIFGGLLVLLLVGAFAFGTVDSGTSVRWGAVALAIIFGLNLLFGVKRHRLTFTVAGRRYRWQSKAGDFKYKIAAVQRVVGFARQQGLLSASGANEAQI